MQPDQNEQVYAALVKIMAAYFYALRTLMGEACQIDKISAKIKEDSF